LSAGNSAHEVPGTTDAVDDATSVGTPSAATSSATTNFPRIPVVIGSSGRYG